jgi:hypothetical protein
MRTIVRHLALLSLVAAVACSDGTSPEGLGIRLDLSLARPVIAGSAQDTITWSLRNLTGEPRTFTASACPVYVNVTGTIRRTIPGLCAAALSIYHLGPHEQLNGSILVLAGVQHAIYEGTFDVAPGHYDLQATFRDVDGALDLATDPIRLTVLP